MALADLLQQELRTCCLSLYLSFFLTYLLMKCGHFLCFHCAIEIKKNSATAPSIAVMSEMRVHACRLMIKQKRQIIRATGMKKNRNTPIS